MADINFENFKQKNTKGLWSVVKTGKGLAIQRKQFSVEDGKEVTPTLEYFNIERAIEIQKELQIKVANITALIKEAELL